jgi:hypothetical protein
MDMRRPRFQAARNILEVNCDSSSLEPPVLLDLICRIG